LGVWYDLPRGRDGKLDVMRNTATSDSSEMPHHGKISVALSARLAQSNPKQRLRTIIVLQTGPSVPRPAQSRPSKENRRDEIGRIQQSASQVMDDIDRILERFDGRRLSQPTALGTIVVESTPSGIAALSASDHVKAILQDQPISRVF